MGRAIASAGPIDLAVAAMRALADADRQIIESAIEALIALLDARDGDHDLEEDNEDRCEAGDDSPTRNCTGLEAVGDDADDEFSPHAYHPPAELIFPVRLR